MEGKYLQQFTKGSLEMILLCLIAQKETYGYELLTQLNEHGAGVLGMPGRGRFTPSSTACRSRGWCGAAWPKRRPMEAQRSITP